MVAEISENETLQNLVSSVVLSVMFELPIT